MNHALRLPDIIIAITLCVVTITIVSGSGLPTLTQLQATGSHIKRRSVVNQATTERHLTSDHLANLAEELQFSQPLQRELAAVKAKEHLARIASNWASIAQNLVTWRARNVMELTKKAQAAQVQSLILSSVATRLKIAVMLAELVYYNAINRLEAAKAVAQNAAFHARSIQDSLDLLNNISETKDKWATQVRHRASKLSTYLQETLRDLKKAMENSHDAHDSARFASNFIVM